jgi:outer membrane lipoprotein-sorting protein
MKKITRLLAVSALLISTSPLTNAADETPEAKGRAIMEKLDARQTDFKDTETVMAMILRNRQGAESQKVMKMLSKREDNGDMKSLTIFQEPADTKGTSLLQHSYKAVGEEDDMWLFLPALGKTKRISGSAQSGSFMGSEFAYEDLSMDSNLDEADFKWIGTEEIEGVTYDIVESYPHDTTTGYSKRKLWINNDLERMKKMEFYDRKQSLLKTMFLENYQDFGDGNVRPMKIKMVNNQTGKETEMLNEYFKFDVGVDSKLFDKSQLKRLAR